MTSQEFIFWLKGFVEACHEYQPTPKQWDSLKDQLEEVSDEPKVTIPLSTPGTTHTPVYPPYYDPYNPYRVTCDGTGTTPINNVGFLQREDMPVNNPTTLTVTTGSGVGYGTVLTTGGPNVMYSTTTAYNPVSGSWHYTTSGDENWNIKHKDLLHD